MLFHLLFALSNQAQAVPLQITQQGRILDNSGTTVVGVHDVTFRMYDTKNSGSPLWSETLVISFNNGYYAAILGTDESGNPLDSSVLGLYPLYLELQLDSNTPMTPRQEITSVPYAQMAGVAESIDGGTVNASEVQIGSVPVIDGNRNWVGEPITVDWSSIQNTPSDLQDGDNDTQLSEGEVENFVTNGGLSLHEDTTLNGEQILTLGMDSDTLADISCSDGDVPKWDAVVGHWDCGLDNDTLANLNCSDGELAKFNGSDWACGEDIDTVLDADTVISYVEQNSLSIPAGSQIDGADILTSADTLEPEWTDIQNRPNGLDDGDDDTQLSQSEVVGYVESGSVNLASGSQVNNRNIVGQPSVCTGGQVLVYNASSNDWECGDDTDTTLTESEMQTMIEAMTLNFQNRPQVNGADVLTTDSTLEPTKLDATGGVAGQVLTTDGSTVSWEDASGSGCNEAMVNHYDGSFYVTAECDTYSYVLKTGGAVNFWSSPNNCSISYIESEDNGVASFVDCGSSTHVVTGSNTSDLIAASLIEDSYYGRYGSHCALTSNGTVSCWGRDTYGQVSNVPSSSFVSLTGGSDFYCGITTVGNIECWGRDYSGLVSNAPTGSFTQISTSGGSACGINTSGGLECWGSNYYGQVTPPSGSFQQVDVTSYHACAIRTNGEIECWGTNWNGMATPPSGNFSYLVSEDEHNCAINTSGAVQCWGRDNDGEVSDVPAATFVELELFYNTSCGITNTQTIECWGSDTYNVVSDVPIGTFTTVKMGEYSACGLSTTGTVTCWGNPDRYHGVPNNTVFSAISRNMRSFCGLLSTGNILCWGEDSEGQLSPP